MIAVTGHTSGIGKAVTRYFINKGQPVLGYSRANGYDIRDADSRKKIIEESSNCAIFVNNAYSNFDRSQILLLNEIFNSWKDNPEKLIINISSRWTSGKNNPYCLTKLELDNFCNERIYSFPKIINLKPGLIDTPRVESINNKKMDVNSINDILDFILVNKNSFIVHSITFGI